MKSCYLESVFRQKKEDFLFHLLNEIRSGEVSRESWQKLEEARGRRGPENLTRLFTHNFDVDSLNFDRLEKLPGQPKIFEARSRGRKNLVETIFRNSLLSPELVLKEGALVMFIKNVSA